MIFKGTGDGRPYPEHGLSAGDWATIPPRQLRLDQLTTVTSVLALDRLLSEDSTFYGDLFAHVVSWDGELYLEDGLHRAVRSALRNRPTIHARVLDLDARVRRQGPAAAPGVAAAAAPAGPPQQPGAPGPARPARPWLDRPGSPAAQPQRPSWATPDVTPGVRGPRHRRADDPGR